MCDHKSCFSRACTYTQTHITCPTVSQLSINTLGYVIRAAHKLRRLRLWGGFSSLCGSDESFGSDAPPGGRTALQRGKWVPGGHRRRSDSSPGGRDVREKPIPVYPEEIADSCQRTEHRLDHSASLVESQTSGVNIWKYTSAAFSQCAALSGGFHFHFIFHFTFFHNNS